MSPLSEPEESTAFMEHYRQIRQEARLRAYRVVNEIALSLNFPAEESTWDGIAVKIADPAAGECLERLREAVLILADQTLPSHMDGRIARLRELLGGAE